jgi:glycosyltransferase involved in cell wall biosynthesis
MRIVHIDTHDCSGGAARAAYRLHDGLRRTGQDSKMFVATKISQDPDVVQFIPSNRWRNRVLRTMRRAGLTWSASRSRAAGAPNYSIISDDRSVYSSEPWHQCPEADIFHLHWVTSFLDHRIFFRSVSQSVPIVWTLHDMNPFTGGCHYDWDCGHFAAQCGACPQLSSKENSDFSRNIWKRKETAYRNIRTGRFHLVTPSVWLGQQLGQSSLLSSFPRSVIPYGLDTDIFQPRDRAVMRTALGIPGDVKVVLFIEVGTNDPRKGFELLADAIRGAEFKSKTVLLCLGAGKAKFEGIPYFHVQTIQDDRLLSFVYSAADIFVAPSLQDNLPNTILESLACGTPVVAFRTGGIPDAVRPDQTGLLVSKGNVQELRAAMAGLLDNDEKRLAISQNCRTVSLQEYRLETQASRYLSLYRELTNSQG